MHTWALVLAVAAVLVAGVAHGAVEEDTGMPAHGDGAAPFHLHTKEEWDRIGARVAAGAGAVSFAQMPNPEQPLTVGDRGGEEDLHPNNMEIGHYGFAHPRQSEGIVFTKETMAKLPYLDFHPQNHLNPMPKYIPRLYHGARGQPLQATNPMTLSKGPWYENTPRAGNKLVMNIMARQAAKPPPETDDTGINPHYGTPYHFVHEVIYHKRPEGFGADAFFASTHDVVDDVNSDTDEAEAKDYKPPPLDENPVEKPLEDSPWFPQTDPTDVSEDEFEKATKPKPTPEPVADPNAPVGTSPTPTGSGGGSPTGGSGGGGGGGGGSVTGGDDNPTGGEGTSTPTSDSPTSTTDKPTTSTSTTDKPTSSTSTTDKPTSTTSTTDKPTSSTDKPDSSSSSSSTGHKEDALGVSAERDGGSTERSSKVPTPQEVATSKRVDDTSDSTGATVKHHSSHPSKTERDAVEEDEEDSAAAAKAPICPVEKKKTCKKKKKKKVEPAPPPEDCDEDDDDDEEEAADYFEDDDSKEDRMMDKALFEQMKKEDAVGDDELDTMARDAADDSAGAVLGKGKGAGKGAGDDDDASLNDEWQSDRSTRGAAPRHRRKAPSAKGASHAEFQVRGTPHERRVVRQAEADDAAALREARMAAESAVEASFSDATADANAIASEAMGDEDDALAAIHDRSLAPLLGERNQI